MGFLKSFKHDIFFSYAHGPESDVSVSPEEERYLQRWTQLAAKHIVQFINFYLQQKQPGVMIEGWIDRSLERTLPVETTLEDEVKQSAIFFCVMTNYYLSSKYCLKEIEWFKDSFADEGNNVRRIFVVRATRTDRATWPKALKSSTGSTVDGYKFYENIEADQEFFDPFGWPVPLPTDQKYWKAVSAIAMDAAKRLWELKQAEQSRPFGAISSQSPPPAGQKIFLGYMHDTLSQAREEVRSKLTELGFSVLPERGDEPYDKASLDAALVRLSECQAAVLIANEYCGRWPQAEAGGAVSYQLNFFRRAVIPTHVWLKIQNAEAAQTVEYRRYLEKLQLEGGKRFSSTSEFCRSFAQWSTLAGVDLAVLVTNKPSEADTYKNFQETIASALSDSGRLILTSNLSSGSESMKLSELESSLHDADTLMVVCFDQKWSWASQLMGQLRQLRNRKTALRHQLFVTGPIVTQPTTLDARTLSFETIDGANVDLPVLRGMIHQKISAPRVVLANE
jgi:hypothetical protein